MSKSLGYNTYHGQKWAVVTKRETKKIIMESDVSPAERFKQARKKALKIAA
jgi:hypothetical protein